MEKVWDKLDEVVGAGILGIVAILSLVLKADIAIAQSCVTGIVALLVVKEVKK